ncbi:enolase [Aspergillus pseudotamarii]|uniref:Enolase n=1 Tax=Aspergillus pseudotamarii TaxID=132259 RepID=A0A5N6SVB3_ASPPS|nr:enolase [Aspergillus pseudotamarii]KAE8138585.1 enolase [Aspergillus pseudotamarii]
MVDHNRAHILAITASQRLDSRGKPTVKVTVLTEAGTSSAIVPSGASVGNYEAHELRDGRATEYGGNSVHQAVTNVEKVIGPELIRQRFNVGDDLAKIDRFMIQLDGSKNKNRLGANAILGVSMACARAGAAVKGVPLYEFLREQAGITGPYLLPVPFFNVLNGGKHSGNTMAFQEFMIAPVGANSVTHAAQLGSEVYQALKSVIVRKHGASAIGVGDEGGFAPPISEPSAALDLLMAANFTAEGKYDLGYKSHKQCQLAATDLGDLYRSLMNMYPIILLEDPFAEDDWAAWTAFKQDCPIELVGDDLLATNLERIETAKERDACNSLLLKINQIGTITESLEAAHKAFSYGWRVFVSHRSGETTDDFIADLSVALSTGHLKSGSPCRGERVVKYNRLMDIEDRLNVCGSPHEYAGTRMSRNDMK